MKANIPEELLNAIDDRIYLDLEIHYLNRKFEQAEKQGKTGYAEHLDKIITQVFNRRKEVNSYLKENGVKIFDVVEDDDAEFVTYPYYQKINGGYKEGEMKYWRAAIKLQLKKRLNKYF